MTTISITPTKLRFVKLVPKPGSDEIMVVVLGDNKDVTGLVWNGTTFSTITALETDTEYNSEECVDAAYEQLTGHCLVVWDKHGTNQPKYSVWNGTAWSAASLAPTIGSKAHWIRLASDPKSNKIIMMTLDDAKHTCVNVWDGSGWGIGR